ncbi:MAG: hypothetical protein JEY94_14140 [Melioribacteraceae bacterium]|nr:hypothetical protein [Melioribacteraceae bacterium]
MELINNEANKEITIKKKFIYKPGLKWIMFLFFSFIIPCISYWISNEVKSLLEYFEILALWLFSIIIPIIIALINRIWKRKASSNKLFGLYYFIALLIGLILGLIPAIGMYNHLSSINEAPNNEIEPVFIFLLIHFVFILQFYLPIVGFRYLIHYTKKTKEESLKNKI